MAPSNRGWLVFGLATDWGVGERTMMMRHGIIPLVNPGEAVDIWRPFFRELARLYAVVPP